MKGKTIESYLRSKKFIKKGSEDFVEIDGLWENLEMGENYPGMDVVVVPTNMGYGKFAFDLYEGPKRKWKDEVLKIENSNDLGADSELLGSLKALIGQGKKPFIVVRDDYNSHGEYLVYAL